MFDEEIKGNNGEFVTLVCGLLGFSPRKIIYRF